MKIIDKQLGDICLFETQVYRDGRGYFQEISRDHSLFSLLGSRDKFVQENHSRSKKNVLRGLHFQEPNPQGKLIIVIAGALQDVVVDVRRGSPNFGRWVSFNLVAGDGKALWIPEGYAHGILSLEEKTDLLYKVTDYWSPKSEQTIRWDDPELNIEWQSNAPILSERDMLAPYLRDATNLPLYIETQ